MRHAKVPALLRRSEHEEQCALFAWAEAKAGVLPELQLLFAIPNFAGRLGKSTARHGARLKAEGRKAGVPDVCLPVARGPWHGLYIEMKREDGVPSDLSREQKAWLVALVAQGYRAVVCYGFYAAQETILQYLSPNTP